MEIRNVAIIAHVDHGKTTLVNQLLEQSDTLRENQQIMDRAMDSNDIERERGITILAKTTAINYKNYRINILDTPGHADFGGEVERIMHMVDGVLLVVDAYEGTMPQTRFVLKKALEAGVKPIVAINKVDKPSTRINEVLDEVLELFMELGANDDQLDFPVVYVSALQGTSSISPDLSTQKHTMDPVLDMIVNNIPGPSMDVSSPLQFQPALLDYNDYVGRIGIGRVARGTIKENDYIIVDDIKYTKVDEKKTKDNIKIIYYDNGYAEIIYNNLNVMVKNSEHIRYNDNIFEIIDNDKKDVIEIKDIMDIKDIKLENKNNTVSNYMIVLEESNNYDKYNISKKLPSKYINYNIYVNGNKIINNVLDKKLDNASGIKNDRNNYLIYEGKIDKLSELTVKVGMWVSYEDITNEYMNSGFVGTMKVYIESK